MVFRFLLLSIILLINLSVFSQDTKEQPPIKRNTIFIEGGYRSGYTLNYDRLLIVKGKWQVSARGGFGFYYNPYDKDRIPTYYSNVESYQLSLPLGINILYGYKASHLEVGLNVNFAMKHSRIIYHTPVYVVQEDNTHYVDYTDNLITTIQTIYYLNTYLSGISIGYRYQKASGGLFFSGGIKPSIGIWGNSHYNIIEHLLPYVNLGYTF